MFCVNPQRLVMRGRFKRKNLPPLLRAGLWSQQREPAFSRVFIHCLFVLISAA